MASLEGARVGLVFPQETEVEGGRGLLQGPHVQGPGTRRVGRVVAISRVRRLLEVEGAAELSASQNAMRAPRGGRLEE